MQSSQVYKKQNIIKIVTTDFTNVNFTLNVYFNAIKYLIIKN